MWRSSQQLGAEAEIVDWCNHEVHDLISDAFYYDLLGRVEQGEFDAALIATPCETFSMARQLLPGETHGPRALRGPSKPDLYGLPGLRPFEKEQCRKGTLLAVRSMEIASRFKAQRKKWILENPYPLRDDEPSVFNLDEARELLNDTDHDIKEGAATALIRSDQCRDGADCCKPTGLMGTKSILQGFGRQCDHPSKWWVYHDYSWVKAPHAPLRRKGHSGKPCPRPVPPGEWYPNMPATCKEYPT